MKMEQLCEILQKPLSFKKSLILLGVIIMAVIYFHQNMLMMNEK